MGQESFIEIEFLEFGTDEVIVPKVSHDYCHYDEEDATEKWNDFGHYKICSNCEEIFYTKPHEFNQYGVCELCGYVSKGFLSLDNKPLQYKSETDLCYSINTYTNEILDVLIPFDEYAKYLTTDIADFTGFTESKELWAPYNYETLDTFYVLDYVCIVDHTWIGSHESVNICPDLKHVGIECSCDDCSSVV